MFNTVAAALAAALLFQSAEPNPRLSPEQEAEIALVMPNAARTLNTLGACEHLAPDFGQRFVASISAPTDDQKRAAVQEYMLQAYERGRTSPEAATVTPEACQAAAKDLQGQAVVIQDQLVQVDDSILIEKLMSISLRMFENLGACERVLPPEIGQQTTADLNAEQNTEARQLLLGAYERGQSAPDAETRTLDSCVAAINALGQDMQAVTAAMQSAAN